MQKGWGKMVMEDNLQLWPKPENIADIHDNSNKIEITYFTPQKQWTGIVEMLEESGRELETQSVSPRSWVLESWSYGPPRQEQEVLWPHPCPGDWSLSFSQELDRVRGGGQGRGCSNENFRNSDPEILNWKIKLVSLVHFWICVSRPKISLQNISTVKNKPVNTQAFQSSSSERHALHCYWNEITSMFWD